MDEAGRGPLAGPVVAAAVLLSPGQRIPGVKDSKQLSHRRRCQLGKHIRTEALAWAIGEAGVEEIDRLNILQASLLAMARAIRGLPKGNYRVRVDGRHAPGPGHGFGGVAETLTGGDRLCPAISAASILAKLYRDDLMLELERRYPGYGFARHQGYPTPQPRSALAERGPSPEHRRSFAPVRDWEALRV